MFIDELKDYIVANSSLVFGSTLFIGNMQDSINNCIVLQQGTTENQYNFDNELGYATINVPVRVRGDQTENTTRALAATLDFLENLTVTLPTYRIARGWFSTPMYQLDGTDSNNNYIYVGIYTAIAERN